MAADVSIPPKGITAPGAIPPIKLAICVTFHYVDARLEYLAAIGSRFRSLAREVVVTVVTNTDSQEHHQRITALFRKNGIEVAISASPALGILTCCPGSISRSCGHASGMNRSRISCTWKTTCAARRSTSTTCWKRGRCCVRSA